LVSSWSFLIDRNGENNGVLHVHNIILSALSIETKIFIEKITERQVRSIAGQIRPDRQCRWKMQFLNVFILG
jgi:hypothetical protein